MPEPPSHAHGLPPVRVLLVNDRPPSAGGGAEVHLQRLADALTATGDEVTLFAGEITHRGWRRVLDLWDPAARRAVALRARDVGAEVVHHHNVLRELSPAVLSATPDLPTVLTVHDHRLLGEADDATPWVRVAADAASGRLLRHQVHRHVDAVVAVSPSLAGELRAAGLPRVEHIPPVVPPPALAPRPVADCHDVLYVGRLEPDKGVAILLEAFGRILDRRPATDLVLVGEGGLVPHLERFGSRVRLTGRLDPGGVSREMGNARVVVIPSVRSEGLGLVALEAAAHARPAIVSDQPALTGVVIADRTGVVVPRGDAPALAAAIDRLLATPEEAAAFGRAARDRLEDRHAQDRVAELTRELYASLGVARG